MKRNSSRQKSSQSSGTNQIVHGRRSKRRSSSTSASSNSSSEQTLELDEQHNLSNIGTSVYDNCCFLIYCDRHQNILLTKGTKKFMPHAQLLASKPWYECSLEAALGIVLGKVISDIQMEHYKQNPPFKQFVLAQIFRYQLPQSERFLTRLIFLVTLQTSKIQCCRSTNICRWYSISEAVASELSTWGPEVSFYANICMSGNVKILNTVEEYSLQDAYKYMNESFEDDQHIDRHQEELSVLLANLSTHDVERLYAEYIEHCFPSFFITRDSFLIFMTKHEIETRPQVALRYFSAFRSRGKHYMEFSELLLGLAAIDSRTSHAEARLKLVFRFYDYDKDQLLNKNEFRRMYEHMHPKQSSINEKRVREEMQKFGHTKVHGHQVITFDEFKRIIGSHAFRGTSRLCRSEISPFTRITRSLAARKLYKTVDFDIKDLLTNRPYEGHCQQCRRYSGYELASNWILLNEQGRCVKWAKIVDNSDKKLANQYSLEVTFPPQYTTLHFLHNAIRVHNKTKGLKTDPKGLFTGKSTSKKKFARFMEDVRRICLDVGHLVEKEDRILKLSEPIYLIGDIHGNLEDLMSIEKTLWRSFPFLTSNFLFLGDYVGKTVL